MEKSANSPGSPLDTRRGALVALASWGGGAAISPLFLWINSLVISLTGLPDCPLYRLTGLHCALCGGTRCAIALSRGDLPTAFYYNPFAIICGCLLLLAGGWILFRCAQKDYRRPWPESFTANCLKAFITVMVLFTVIRNLPFYQSVFF